MIKKLRMITYSLLLLFSFNAFAQETHPIVENISAKLIARGVIKVEWNTTKHFDAASLVIYRSLKPFTSKSQILSMDPLAEVKSGSTFYTDTVTNYQDYYYAVMVRKTDNTIYSIVLPSINATVYGVRQERKTAIAPQEEEKEVRTYESGQKRELPLPYLDLIDYQRDRQSSIDKDIAKNAADLAYPYNEKEKKYLDPYIFDQDIEGNSSGDDYYLFEILKNSFIVKDYQTSASDLIKLLSVNRSKSVTDRSVFYLAQSQYYNGRYRQALTLFLYLQDDYPALCKKWIESTLDLYEQK